MEEQIDFDNPTQCRLIHDYMRTLKGKHRVKIVRDRPRRSDRQNRFYWPAIVHPFAEWLSEQYGETFTDEDAHYVLKKTFLSRKVRNQQTGKVLDLIGSSAALSDADFSAYLEKCIHLLAEHCDIVVEDPCRQGVG